MRTGVCGFDCSRVLGDHLGIGDICIASIWGGVDAGKGCRADGLQVISGTLPRMLFLICCECVLFVILGVGFAVR